MNMCNFVLLLVQTLCVTICCFMLGAFGELGFVLKMQICDVVQQYVIL